MARKPRVYYPGALYDVTLRGNAGQATFFDNRDRTRFYLLLQEGTERFRHRIHAFCLMSNHVHLAIQVGDRRDLMLPELSTMDGRKSKGRDRTVFANASCH